MSRTDDADWRRATRRAGDPVDGQSWAFAALSRWSTFAPWPPTRPDQRRASNPVPTPRHGEGRCLVLLVPAQQLLGRAPADRVPVVRVYGRFGRSAGRRGLRALRRPPSAPVRRGDATGEAPEASMLPLVVALAALSLTGAGCGDDRRRGGERGPLRVRDRAWAEGLSNRLVVVWWGRRRLGAGAARRCRARLSGRPPEPRHAVAIPGATRPCSPGSPSRGAVRRRAPPRARPPRRGGSCPATFGAVSSLALRKLGEGGGQHQPRQRDGRGQWTTALSFTSSPARVVDARGD
jgi:hypothetical protein